MKTTAVVLLLLFAPLCLADSEPELLWSSYVGNPLFRSNGLDVGAFVVDGEGNAFVSVVQAEGYLPQLDPLFVSDDAGPVGVVKFSPSGQLLWASRMPMNWSTPLRALVDDSDNLLIAGYGSIHVVQDDGADGWQGGVSVIKVSADNQLVYSTYVGGTKSELMVNAFLDSGGNAIIAGTTYSDDFPLLNAYDSEYAGYGEAFLAKISPQGNLLWSTYIGGNRADELKSAVCDPAGRTYIVMETASTDLPTPGGYPPTTDPFYDDYLLYLARINQSGKITWGTYITASSQTKVVATPANEAVFTGQTLGEPIHTVHPFQGTPADGRNGFVLKVAAEDRIAFCSYIGGDVECAIVDSLNNIILFAHTAGDFIAKVTPSGSLAWSTSIRGSHVDYCLANVCTVDSNGDVYAVLHPHSDDLPVSDDCIMSHGDSYVARISRSGQFLWGTYVDGTLTSSFVDVNGCFVGIGCTESTEFPAGDGFQTDNAGAKDVFVIKILPDGHLAWTTYLGGSLDDTTLDDAYLKHCFLSNKGSLYVTGITWSHDFPTPGGLDQPFGFPVQQVFITAVSVHPEPLSVATASVPEGTASSPYSATLSASGGQPPYVWSLSSGALPAGITLDAAGVLSGTPSSHGSYVVTVQVQDAAAITATRTLTLVTAPAPLVIATTSLPPVSQGLSYSQSLSATGGISPYLWSLDAGDLPAGLSLSGSGVISGTPTASGIADFTVRVTDAQPVSATKALSITVHEPDLQGPAVSSLATLPSLVRTGLDKSLVLTATASDVAKGDSNIASAEYRIGAGSWRTMLPSDGSFNSPVENAKATVDTNGWSSNTLLYVRAQDAAGNWSTAASILVPVVDGVAPGRVKNLKAVATNDFAAIPVTPVDSSGDAPGAPLANLVDSNPLTYWQSLETLTAEDVFVTLDMGSVKEISAVGLKTPRSKTLFPTQFMIETSENGSDWDTVAVVEGLRPVSSMLWQFEPVQARYVRISGPSMYDRRSKRYSWQLGEVGIYDCDGSSLVTLTWTAPADDGYTGSPIALYDLRCGDSAITASTFGACTGVPLAGAPANPGLPEQKTLGLEASGTLYLALKAGDEVPNWSPSSNSAKVFAGPTGFMSTAPDDASQATADVIPTFEYAADATARPVYITFSSVPGFVARTTKRANGRVDKTIRFALRKGSTSWTPSTGQWKSIKKIVSTDGSLYWRLEGRSRANGTIYGPARVIYFDCGEIDDLAVTQAGTPPADTIWPVKTSLPFFTWTNDTVDMKYFYVDISSDPSMPMKDRKKSLTICRRGTLGESYTPSAGEWLRIRRLATWLKSKSVPEPAEGVLYWRVRATDAQKALSCACVPQQFVVDGGTWNVDSLDLSVIDPVATWTHTGEGIVKYSLEICADGLFTPSSRETLKVPSKGRPEMFHAFTARELSILSKFAAKKGVAELHWRVRGEDIQRAFISYSESQTTPAP